MADLTDQQARNPGVPSGTNLAGLVFHLTECERHWFAWVFHNDDIPAAEWSMTAPEGSMMEDLIADYRAAAERSDDIVRSHDLTIAERLNPGEEQHASLRIITAHMIRETGRHAGHADILREQIDGATEL